MTYDSQGKSVQGPSPEFVAWAEAHNIKSEEQMNLLRGAVGFLALTGDPSTVTLQSQFTINQWCPSCSYLCVVHSDGTWSPASCDTGNGSHIAGSLTGTITATAAGTFAASDCNFHNSFFTLTAVDAQGTRTFNVSEITHNSIPDAEGNIVPAGIHEGSAEIAGALGENQHILIAMDSGIYNVRKATCGTYYCATCNGIVQVFVTDDPFAMAVGGSKQETFGYEYNTGAQYDVTSTSNWSSSNTSIATVSAGLTSGIAVGQVNISAIYPYQEPQFETPCQWNSMPSCPTVYIVPSGSGGGNVMSLTCSPSSVTRGNSATCTVNDAPSGATFSNWKFTDSNNTTVTRGGNNNVSSWSGTLVTTGTVSVTVNSAPLSASITVTNRNWHTSPASPTQVPNGTFFALPLPPQPSGSFSGLGYSNWRAAYGSLSYLTIGDGGPNQGYTYFTSNFSWTNFDYRYEINPDLENTGSTFYQAQCGNYNATTNPNGFISGADLLTQTRRHEYNSSTQSHYAFYSVAVSSAADNPGDYIEQQIAVPGADLNTFNTNVQSGITSRFNDVSSAVSHEDPPWPVNYNENNIALGNINYAPYTACQ
jgi:hypothetical protein